MKTKINILIIAFVLGACSIWAQGDGNYLPYEIPGHTAVKYNTYLMHPAFPIFNKNESQITFFHRNQWMGFKDEKFNTFALSYGKKWGGDASRKKDYYDGNNMAHGMIFQRNASFFSNTGLLGNYVHQVEISRDNYLRLGLNFVFARSGINKSKVRSNVQDPLVENAKTTSIINLQPGVDVNFGYWHFGLTAENLLDYAFSVGEMAVPFNEKSLTAHVMYRKEIQSNSDFLEDGFFSVMAKGKKTKDNFQFGANIMLDVKMGWVYAGYDQKYGVFGGLGFNVSNHLSIGFGYEQSTANYIAEQGGSYDVLLSYQFGGKHHIKKPKVQPKNPPVVKEPPVVKPPEPKVVTPTVTVTQTPTPPPAPPKPRTPMDELSKRIKVVEDDIDNIPPGYYVIVGVYNNPGGAYKMTQEIRQKLEVDVATFMHPNGLTYIYVDKPYETRGDAGERLINLLRRPEFKNSKAWILKVGK
jgi:bacteroidetes-specific putative membrane protein|nr:PorP/SprF family type IX secretion system membrane protein [uncultured Capnocytophaga sp.]